MGNRTTLSAVIGGVKDFISNYSYDALSRLYEIDQQGQTGGNAVADKSVYYGLDAIGDVTAIDRANTVDAGPQQNGPAYSVLSYSTTTGRLTGINHDYLGSSLDNLTYTYDGVGRVSGQLNGTGPNNLAAAEDMLRSWRWERGRLGRRPGAYGAGKGALQKCFIIKRKE